MKINLKAGEHVRIENDSGAGFTAYVEGRILHVTARALNDPMPDSEIVREPDYWRPHPGWSYIGQQERDEQVGDHAK